ncbi:MAG: hypothetical protein V7739_09475 [Motiliproteus sp.]
MALLSALGIGGYFLAIAVEDVHEENIESLADFGSIVTPGGAPAADGSSTGVDGQQQLAPTFGEEKLSASDKIIISLSKEKELLVREMANLQRKIGKQTEEIALLTRYKDTNERFAPRMLHEEKERAIKELQSYLEDSKDAERFTGFQKEAMALDSANVYLTTLRKYQLVFDESQKDLLISTHLPAYAFCIGDSIGIIANSRTEEKKVLKYLRGDDNSTLSKLLMEDLQAIRSPCLHALNGRINILLKG